MIVELTPQKLVLRSFGTDFTLDLGIQIFKVPDRGNPEKKLKLVSFDMGKFVATRKFPSGTTSDVANCVYDLVKHKWPSCEEKTAILSTIQQYVADQRDIRRDRFVLTLGSLYGINDAVWISAGIRTHAFIFPVGHLIEETTSKLIKLLRHEYRGAASAMQFPPQSVDQASRALFRYAGSKTSSQFYIQATEMNASDDQVYIAFTVTSWLEKHTEV